MARTLESFMKKCKKQYEKFVSVHDVITATKFIRGKLLKYEFNIEEDEVKTAITQFIENYL